MNVTILSVVFASLRRVPVGRDRPRNAEVSERRRGSGPPSKNGVKLAGTETGRREEFPRGVTKPESHQLFPGRRPLKPFDLRTSSARGRRTHFSTSPNESLTHLAEVSVSWGGGGGYHEPLEARNSFSFRLTFP